ncbi:porin [Paraburkholderia sp. J12]|uniref:porin n=1 Tax=Paraburkholderia sp. J12 TaxID=2805432 RepID=UPI002ABE0110|nr:porin [Paraburkholderia sp. J12]
MKVRPLAAAVAIAAAGTPLTALAQSSVTLYGEIDTGIQYLTHAGTNGGSQLGMSTGSRQPTFFGIRATEDLGGNTNAVVNLSSVFNSNDGSQFIPGVEFSNEAYVGLSNPTYGTLTAGRHFSVLFDNTIIYDASYFAKYSVFSDNFIPAENFWVDNSIKYKSPEIAGVSGELLYKFGGVAGDNKAGRVIEASLKYASGGFMASATYSGSNGGAGMSSGRDTRAAIGAKYSFSGFTISGGYENISGSLQLSPAGCTYFGGVGYQVSSALNLNAEVYRYDYRGSNASATGYVGSASYYLSKRTSLYLLAGYVDNRGAANFGLNPYTTTGVGQGQLGVTAGILHLF